MTLLRRLVVMRWLEWEHVRGLNNLKCCEKEVVGRRVEEMRGDNQEEIPEGKGEWLDQWFQLRYV